MFTILLEFEKFYTNKVQQFEQIPFCQVGWCEEEETWFCAHQRWERSTCGGFQSKEEVDRGCYFEWKFRRDFAKTQFARGFQKCCCYPNKEGSIVSNSQCEQANQSNGCDSETIFSNCSNKRCEREEISENFLKCSKLSKKKFWLFVKEILWICFWTNWALEDWEALLLMLEAFPIRFGTDLAPLMMCNCLLMGPMFSDCFCSESIFLLSKTCWCLS